MKKTIWFCLCLSIISLTVSVRSYAKTLTVCSSGCNVTTIQAAFNNSLSPGDIVEIQDSRTYNENVAWGANNGVTLRAAIGQTPVIAGYIEVNAVNNCKIGASGYGTITVAPGTAATSWIDGAIDINNANNNIVENTTIRDVYDGNGIMLQNGSSNNTIQRNTVYNIGTSHFSDGTQGEGIIVYLSGKNNIIQNNTVHDCAHGNIGVYGGNTTNATGNQVLNNTIYGGRGEGVSILDTQYCLADGNMIYNVGTVQTNKSKPAIQLSSSSHCSVRRNVIYNGHHYWGIEMSVYNDNWHVDGNYIYNNTIHTWGTNLSNAGAGNAAVFLGGHAVVGSTTSGNKFYNNIFWNVDLTGETGWGDNTHKLIFHASYEQMPAGTDWGSSLTALQESGLGGHEIKNNILRSNGGVNYPYILAYGNNGDTYEYEGSTSDLNSNFPAVCSKNIESDPHFAKKPPSPNWWYLLPDSPAIDAGIVVFDTNAATGGWDQLTYNGAGPDIGAYESPYNSMTRPLPPNKLKAQ
jgi:hypothetical protein